MSLKRNVVFFRFAFNCGSTESVLCESQTVYHSLVDLYCFLTANSEKNNLIPYHAVPSIIAVNMILAGASGGLLAVIIAVWAQVPHVYLYSSIVMIMLL